uniref:RAD9 checkpoint clamp component B n=1 Tax=Oryzias latipes TaxID=8090 RepID=A0A3B3IEI1_ORYLA
MESVLEQSVAANPELFCPAVFGRAVHALSRVGDELWLDPTVKGLALRSVNSAQSAYACFIFSPLFFQQYSFMGCVPKQSSKTSLLPLFRCLTSIERNVECCQISYAPNPLKRPFLLAGITKTHNLRFQEKEALQAEFASHLCTNVLKAPARFFGEGIFLSRSTDRKANMSTFHFS